MTERAIVRSSGGWTRRDVIKSVAITAGACLVSTRVSATNPVHLHLVVMDWPVASAELWDRAGIEGLDVRGPVVLVADGVDALASHTPRVLLSRATLLSLPVQTIAEAASFDRTTVFDALGRDFTALPCDDDVVERLHSLRACLPHEARLVAVLRKVAPSQT